MKKYSFFQKVKAKLIRDLFPIRRYEYLYSAIRQNQCKKILEIGTWDGRRAVPMIEEAKKYSRLLEVEYYGFDLFELFTPEINKGEFSKKPRMMAEIKQKLEMTGAKIELFKGFTRDTLPKVAGRLPKMDLIFIDGGHKVETIINDWKYTKEFMDKKTVMIFDDYYRKDDSVGCKKAVEAIDQDEYNVEVLQRRDRVVTSWWKLLDINFVRVTKK